MLMKQHLTEKFVMGILICYFFLISFTVSSSYNKLLPIPTSAILTLLAGITLVIYYFYNKKQTTFNSNLYIHEKLFLFAFFVPAIISSIFSFIPLNNIISVEYLNFFKTSMPKRVVYYIAFFILVYFILKSARLFSEKQVIGLVKAYTISLYLIVIVGFWQLIAFLFDVPFLDISTRSYLHNVSSDTLFNFRLTSFADEPSYLGPVLIDLLLLGILLFKKKYIYFFVVLIPTLIVLTFSFSFSAYANIALLLGFILLVGIFSNKTYRKYSLIFIAVALVITLGLFITKNEFFMSFFAPILGRFETLFDIQSHSRMYMYVMPIVWLFNQNFLIALFGYGPGAFEFLSDTRILPNRTQFSVSSNNMYIDYLFEHGLIGFIILMVGIIYLLVKLMKHLFKNQYYFVSTLLFVHLLITSLYRADFVTPRFWGVLIIIFLLIRLAKGSQRKEKI